MKIGIDGNEANVERRVGSNQYAFELLHALYDLPEAKKHEWIIYLRDTPLPDMPKETSWWKYKVFGPKRLWTQFALPFALFFGERPEVFFTPGHYRPRWSPIPTVVSIMDLGYLRMPSQFTRRDLYQLTSWTAHSIKKAEHLIAISESTKRDIIMYYKIPRSKITVTYPGYDKVRYQVSGIKYQEIEKIKKRYGIKNDYILFLSTLKPSKNVEGLIEAFGLLGNWDTRKKTPSNPVTQQPSDLQLVIAGKKGWLYESIFEKVKQLVLEDNVIFTDFVPDEDVPPLMSGAKVFVLPSFWEGFGIPVVEAMAVGTPVVVSTVGSLPEVVGDAGILVNPDDPGDIARGIKEALKNHDALSKKGLARAKNFDWRKTAKKTLSVLEKVA